MLGTSPARPRRRRAPLRNLNALKHGLLRQQPANTELFRVVFFRGTIQRLIFHSVFSTPHPFEHSAVHPKGCALSSVGCVEERVSPRCNFSGAIAIRLPASPIRHRRPR